MDFYRDLDAFRINFYELFIICFSRFLHTLHSLSYNFQIYRLKLPVLWQSHLSISLGLALIRSISDNILLDDTDSVFLNKYLLPENNASLFYKQFTVLGSFSWLEGINSNKQQFIIQSYESIAWIKTQIRLKFASKVTLP